MQALARFLLHLLTASVSLTRSHLTMLCLAGVVHEHVHAEQLTNPMRHGVGKADYEPRYSGPSLPWYSHPPYVVQYATTG